MTQAQKKAQVRAKRLPRFDLTRGFDLRQPKDIINGVPAAFINKRHTICHMLWPDVPGCFMRVALPKGIKKTDTDDFIKVWISNHLGRFL